MKSRASKNVVFSLGSFFHTLVLLHSLSLFLLLHQAGSLFLFTEK
jgi:hypothetical protein